MMKTCHLMPLLPELSFANPLVWIEYRHNCTLSASPYVGYLLGINLTYFFRIIHWYLPSFIRKKWFVVGPFCVRFSRPLIIFSRKRLVLQRNYFRHRSLPNAEYTDILVI